MEELKPCPFCGGEAEVCEGGINGRMQVYGLVEHKDGCFFLVDGLPTRYQHIMEGDFNAWNKRAERTCTKRFDGCKVAGVYDYGDRGQYREYALSCGHVFEWNDEEPPNCCPECGSKVVS